MSDSKKYMVDESKTKLLFLSHFHISTTCVYTTD